LREWISLAEARVGSGETEEEIHVRCGTIVNDAWSIVVDIGNVNNIIASVPALTLGRQLIAIYC
jgi:hypothetical protein